MQKPFVSIVLGTYNRKPFLERCLETLRDELHDFPHEIIVIDGGSTDGTTDWLVTQKDVISIVQHNRGTWRNKEIERRSWGYFMNLGFRCAQGKYVCLVSDDCLVVPGAIRNGYHEFEALRNSGKNVGALAFYWRNWPEETQYFVVRVNGHIYLNNGLYLKEALEKVNYINEDDYFFYNADIDLSFRILKAGYTIEATEKSLIEHYNHANLAVRKSNKHTREQDGMNFENNWQDLLGGQRPMDVTSFIVSDIVPDEAFVQKGFGDLHQRHTLKQSMRPLKQFWRRVQGFVAVRMKALKSL